MRKIVKAIEDHGTMRWDVSWRNESAIIDGPTHLGVLIFDSNADEWIGLTVSIVDGSTVKIEYGPYAHLAIADLERQARTTQ